MNGVMKKEPGNGILQNQWQESCVTWHEIQQCKTDTALWLWLAEWNDDIKITPVTLESGTESVEEWEGGEEETVN